MEHQNISDGEVIQIKDNLTLYKAKNNPKWYWFLKKLSNEMQYQKIFRFYIKNPRMNLLQSRTIWGYFLPKVSSKCSSNWTKKSLHSKIISLLCDRSSKMFVIFLIKKFWDCSLPLSYLMLVIRIFI